MFTTDALIRRMSAPSFRHGAKHSLPGDIIETSEGPPVAGGGISKIQISEIKLHPNDDFSTLIMKISDVDSIRSSHVLNRTADGGDPPRFCENLEDIKKMTF